MTLQERLVALVQAIGADIKALWAGKADVAHSHPINEVDDLQVQLDTKMPLAYKGAMNGVAPLDSSGKVPISNLPAIGPSSTDALPEGSANLYHTAGRAAAAAPVQSVNSKTGAVALNAADIGAAPSAHVGTGGTAHANATTSVDGFMSSADKTKLNGIAVSAAALGDVVALDLGTASAGTGSTAARIDHRHKLPTVADIGAAASDHTHTPASIGAAAAAHGHAISDVTGLQTNLDALKSIPGNVKSTAYTLVMADAGQSIDTTANVTIPSNSAVAFPVGTTVMVTNTSASDSTISITTDTLRQAGTTNTGSRTLAGYGVATLRKVAATTWYISGAGLS